MMPVDPTSVNASAAAAAAEATEIQAILDATLGPLVVGGFLTVFCFGIICSQTIYYLQHFPKDRWLVKGFVIFLWISQLAYTIAICQGTYGVSVGDFGQIEALTYAPWGLSAGQILGGVIDHLIQAFFVLQIYRATHRLFLGIVLWTLVVLLETLAAYLCAQLLKTHSIPLTFDDQKNHRFLLLLFFGDATMDLVNAAILCFHLKVQREAAFTKTTLALVDRLLMYTLQTGLTTSLVAFAAAIAYAINQNNYIWVIFFELLPCSFLSALLSNINNRANLRSYDVPESTGIPSGFGTSYSGPSTGSASHGRGVQVQIAQSVVLARDIPNGRHRSKSAEIGVSFGKSSGDHSPAMHEHPLDIDIDEERVIEMNKLELDTERRSAQLDRGYIQHAI
ncbi:Zn(2)-C6 fungal-type domain-containing protein [Mycena chlorophos]|uniref:Zn(2)-C6 fungal-type domain-containing protein n=1 Tax=Mycena chlorophos TaxID=658473 RepID=A0A8H6STA4_MYCCL|nr:Zn(2)-C6 fungal-type domain-containing protein [Mycena chlorophos]